MTNRWDKVSAYARAESGQRRITGGVQSQTTERYAHNPVQSNPIRQSTAPSSRKPKAWHCLD